jgi:hypothetical protein
MKARAWWRGALETTFAMVEHRPFSFSHKVIVLIAGLGDND